MDGDSSEDDNANTTTIIKNGKNNFQFLNNILNVAKIWCITPGTSTSRL